MKKFLLLIILIATLVVCSGQSMNYLRLNKGSVKDSLEVKGFETTQHVSLLKGVSAITATDIDETALLVYVFKHRTCVEFSYIVYGETAESWTLFLDQYLYKVTDTIWYSVEGGIWYELFFNKDLREWVVTTTPAY